MCIKLEACLRVEGLQSLVTVLATWPSRVFRNPPGKSAHWRLRTIALVAVLLRWQQVGGGTAGLQGTSMMCPDLPPVRYHTSESWRCPLQMWSALLTDSWLM